MKTEREGVESLLFQIIRDEKGFLLLTAMIFLFFITHMMIASSAAYDSHYRAYDALKIAAVDQTKMVLNSIEEDREDVNMEDLENNH